MSGQNLGSTQTRRRASVVSPPQSWAILSRHAREEILPLEMPELCRDTDRVSALLAVHNSRSVAASESNQNSNVNHVLIVDLSRQFLTEATLNHLLNLAAALDLPRFIKGISWAPNHPDHPVRPPSSSFKNQGSVNKPERDMNPWNKEHRKINATFSNEVMDSTPTEQSLSCCPSAHMALRVPNGNGNEMYDATTGMNILTQIHAEWHRIERFSDSVRLGRLNSATGHMMRDILVLGRGVSVSALRFVYDALCRDEAAILASRFGLSSNKNDGSGPSTNSGGRMRVLGQLAEAWNPPLPQTVAGSATAVGRRMKFLDSNDPIEVSSVLADLDPSTTLVITISFSETDEMAFVTPLVQKWLIQKLTKHSNDDRKAVDALLATQMILVTCNESASSNASSTIYKPELIFQLPSHARCPPFTSCTAATLLPLATTFGWSTCQEFLAGAHDLDLHFAKVNPRHNLPVLLALTDIWNKRILHTPTRAIVPFSNALRSFPSYVAALEKETCRGPSSVESRLSQSDEMLYSELIVAMDCQTAFHTGRFPFRLDDVHAAHDAQVCSCFAFADELAFGTTVSENNTNDSIYSSQNIPVSSPRSIESYPCKSEGYRPCSILLCGKLDAFTCGQMIALSEHRAAVKAHILGQDPFMLQELGWSSLNHRMEKLFDKVTRFDFPALQDPMQENDGTDEFDTSPSELLSTETLLGHYASLMRNERLYTADNTQSTK